MITCLSRKGGRLLYVSAHLDQESDSELVRGMQHPTSWDPYLKAYMTATIEMDQVVDAWKMLPIDASRAALNSSSLCWTVSPSVSAREKLATT